MEKIDELKISGIRPVQEALRSGRTISKVLISENLSQALISELSRDARNAGIPVTVVPPAAIERETRGAHQGVLAYLPAIDFVPLKTLLKQVSSEGGALVMLDGVTDVRNFGAICRTAECMGFSGVIVAEQGTARIGTDAVKSSAGALLRLPVARVKNLVEACSEMGLAGIHIYSITEKGDMSLEEISFAAPLCLVLGDEGKGISRGVLQCSDHGVAIPMSGNIASLNVGVAFGMAAFAVQRQIRK
jgi:23S rRNA (guanosine2251-2'-O)-methyltransferase